MIIPKVLVVAIAIAMAPEKQPAQPTVSEQRGQPAKGEHPSAMHADAATRSAVHDEVLAAMIGVRGGDLAAMALYALASAESLDGEAARGALELADDGVAIARDSARDLGEMKALSAHMHNQASGAKKKLEQADATIDGLRREVGRAGKGTAKKDMERMRTHASKLHGELLEVERSIQTIADEYGIETKLSMPEKAAARPKP